MIGGYTTAVVFGGWSLTPAPAGAWTLTAAVRQVAVPRGWVTAPKGLQCVVPELTGGAWWRVRSIVLGDRELRAVLDPPVPTL